MSGSPWETSSPIEEFNGNDADDVDHDDDDNSDNFLRYHGRLVVALPCSYNGNKQRSKYNRNNLVTGDDLLTNQWRLMKSRIQKPK